jgi:hypothetical protein
MRFLFLFIATVLVPPATPPAQAHKPFRPSQGTTAAKPAPDKMKCHHSLVTLYENFFDWSTQTNSPITRPLGKYGNGRPSKS